MVYSIPCKDSDAIYIEQTSKKLKSRIYEHKRSCSKDVGVTALVKHSHDHDNLFDFDKVKIVATEPNFYKRFFLEMFHIIKEHEINQSLNGY